MTSFFSKEGFEKLKNELAEREGKLRAEIARRIADAKELGDLSENAEYAEAREAQSINEGRIEELREILKNASVINSNQHHKSVAVGSTVVADFKGKQKKFTIVGPAESDPLNGFISNESPLGEAFIGKKKGDEVVVNIPTGTAKYKILEIH